MNLPEPQSLTFASLMSDIEKGYIKVPQFQREFVWSKEKSARLLDSIVKGYPIGTIVFWKTNEELRVLRDLGGLHLPSPPKGDYVQYVVDGQQRLTTLFVALKGLKIWREDREEDYSQFFLDLEASEDEQIVCADRTGASHDALIKLSDLLYGKLKTLTAYAEPLQDRIQEYKDRINAYQFATVLIRDAPIDVVTDIFTRLNLGGKRLTVFEIMVAKTFDSKRNFDLAEKYDELVTELDEVGYGTVPQSVVLQTLSIMATKACRKKDILELPRDRVIDLWPETANAIKSAIEYLRDAYRIPVSNLVPYPILIVPFAYYFHNTNRRPTGVAQRYLQDFFWRVALGGRYSQGLEGRLSQDIQKIDLIIKNRQPKYDWPVDTSAWFVKENGWFSLSRSYIKALLCILSYQQPESFADNTPVHISNDWLKQANSRNYHHFFPKAYLEKEGEEEDYINHIANITIVDDYLNKREIRAQAPSRYVRRFQRENPRLAACMRTHLISLDAFGVFENDYDKFFSRRCKAFSHELRKRIIPQEIDRTGTPLSAEDTSTTESDEAST